MTYKLSYIITTYNKLPYLKVVLEQLLNNINEDEEIVITDGGSTDGTVEYLESLLEKGKIHKFHSEKDKGEAHGFNKAILLSRGELIKIITDDDAYCYPAIKMCKEFMLSHPEIDILGGNTGSILFNDLKSLCWDENYENEYLKWKKNEIKNFFFNGTCLMLRKSSLPVLGLFNTNMLLVDMEYTLRVTCTANLAWYTGVISIRILNEQSNNLKFAKRAIEEDNKLCKFYEYTHFSERNKKFGLKFKKAFTKTNKLKLLKKIKDKVKIENVVDLYDSIKTNHDYCIEWIVLHNSKNKMVILMKR